MRFAFSKDPNFVHNYTSLYGYTNDHAAYDIGEVTEARSQTTKYYFHWLLTGL
jgi:hypothetical protein